MNLASLITEAHSLGLEVKDTMFQHEAAGIGSYPATPVGPECRSITVVYDGPVEVVTDPDADFEQRAAGALLWQSADPTIRALGDNLLAACREEGACLWFGHAQAGYGCKILYLSSRASRAAQLAEDIRATRVRAVTWPGVGHEQRLSDLMLQIGGAS